MHIQHTQRGAALLLGLSLLLGLGTTGCEAESHVSEEEAHFPVTHPLEQDTTLTREYVAQIHAIQHIELRAMETGYLQTTFIDEGRAVSAGDRLFQLLPSVYQAEKQHADAEAALAEIELRTTADLQAHDVVSPNELAMAQARRDRAVAERSLAQAHLGFTELRAPFDGIVGRLEVRNGSLLEEGELLTTLSDNSQMWVYFNVTEAEYLRYRRQLMHDHTIEVQLRLADNTIFEQTGVIETIAADFNNETGNIAFRATFPNPDGLLRHGETGKVIMTTELDDALVIPQRATFDLLDRKYVFVIDDQGIAHQREIKVRAELPHIYVISEGLTTEDNILIDGLRKVRDGHHVSTDFEEPEEVMSHLDLHAE